MLDDRNLAVLHLVNFKAQIFPELPGVPCSQVRDQNSETSLPVGSVSVKCVSVVFRVLAQILGHQITPRNLFSVSLWPFTYGQKTKFQTHNFIFSSVFCFFGSIVD